MAARTGAARTRLRLALGAALGLGLAAADLIGPRNPPPPGLPPDAIATVNGEAIPLATYRRALAALASDRTSPLDEADRRRVLDRVIEEELLVQRGIELGLVRSDRRVRGDLVAAVIASATAAANAAEPDSEEVERFYRENRSYFALPPRVRARQVFVRAARDRPDPRARSRAAEATRLLRAGADFDEVRRELGDPEVAPLPDTPLPAHKLRDYLGPSATRAVLSLTAGGVTDPIRTAGGYRVIQVVARSEPRVPPLAEIAAEVRAELRRRAGDEALRSYLSELRRRGRVRVREPLP